jgi:hypothetical protein
MSDWVTVTAELATGAGTLVLAVATFSATRSANRAARVAERSFLTTLRPMIMPTAMQDPMQKIAFADNHWVHVEGGRAAAEATDEAIYLAIPLRNAGPGMAILHSWQINVGPLVEQGTEHSDLAHFRVLGRDLYVPQQGTGFWHGALRDPADDTFRAVAKAIAAREQISIEIYYGDNEGGQRAITRFGLTSREGTDAWFVHFARHWDLDRPVAQWD